MLGPVIDVPSSHFNRGLHAQRHGSSKLLQLRLIPRGGPGPCAGQLLSAVLVEVLVEGRCMFDQHPAAATVTPSFVLGHPL